jgi:hypothetical protein
MQRVRWSNCRIATRGDFKMRDNRILSTALLLAASIFAIGSFAGEKKSEADVVKETSPSQYMVVHDLKKAGAIKGASGIVVVESFAASDRAFTVYKATTLAELKTYLKANAITPEKITLIRDINTPARGGGAKAGDQLRPGHQVFVIERDVPGVGNFPDNKKMAISKKSNAAIAQIGKSIEWDHSYLTDEGTYCIYRATDENTIREHGKIIGARIIGVYSVKKASLAMSH